MWVPLILKNIYLWNIRNIPHWAQLTKAPSGPWHQVQEVGLVCLCVHVCMHVGMWVCASEYVFMYV